MKPGQPLRYRAVGELVPAECSLGLGRELILKLGLFGQEVKRPSQGVRGGFVPGKIEGRGVVDREAPRLFGGKSFGQRIDQCLEKIALTRLRTALVDQAAEDFAKIHTPAPGRVARRRDGDHRKPEQRLDSRSGNPIDCAGDMAQRLLPSEPRVAAEQGFGNDQQGRAGRVLGKVAGLPVGPGRTCSGSSAGEDWPLALDGRRGKTGSDDPPLIAPQIAIGGQQALADHRREDLLRQPRTDIVGRVLQNHLLDAFRSKRHVNGEAEHLPPVIGLFEHRPRPAVDAGPGALSDEATPGCDRAAAARWTGRDEPRHSAASRVSAPPRSTETSRLIPCSIIVTP